MANDYRGISTANLLEREAVLDGFRSALEDARKGHGRLVLLAGEAGVGKSTVVRAFCDEVRSSARVLWGGCEPLFTPSPLGPFLDIAQEDAELRAALEHGPAEVATAILRAAAMKPTTIVVVEDVHWADEATLDVLRLLGRRLGLKGVLVVATYRDDVLDRVHPLRVVIGELVTHPHVQRMSVPPLTAEAVAELADSSELDAVELHRLTGGNPFFVTEVLASGSGAVPATVRDAVLARAARLSDGARALLDAVAIAPPRVELWLLEALAGEHFSSLNECLTAGMLVERDGAIEFRHELARLAIEESLEPARRLDLHRTALAALDSPNGGTSHVARLAYHAGAAADVDAVLRYAPAAAARATLLGAHREAAAHYARALRHGDRLTPGERGDLFREQANALLLTEQLEESIAAVTRAIEEYREIGDRLREGDALRIRSIVAWGPGYIEACTRDGWDAVSLLESVPASRELALAYAQLSDLHREVEDTAAARVWAVKGIELGRRLGARDVEIRATTELGGAEVLDRDPAGPIRLEEALSTARAAGLVAPVGRLYLFLNWAGMLTRDYTITDRHLADGLQHCSDHGLELYRLIQLAFAARIALDRGHWDEAADHANAALRVQRSATTPRIIALVALALVRARRGDPDVRAVLDEAWALAEPTGEIHRMSPVALARAEVAWLAGRHEDIALATDAVLDLAVARLRPWPIAELLCWRRRAGIHDEVGVEPHGPFAAEAAGDSVSAAEQWTQIGCPYEAALALVGADEEEPLRRALEELQRLGARPAAAIVARRLQERGVRNLRRGPRPSTRSNEAHLTTRELQVLALLADGLRNAAIAERLFVSPRTVDHHVAAILRKLDAQSRGEAVAEAGRLGLLQDRQPAKPI